MGYVVLCWNMLDTLRYVGIMAILEYIRIHWGKVHYAGMHWYIDYAGIHQDTLGYVILYGDTLQAITSTAL